MAWKRELILARLFVVLQAVPGLAYSVRNRGDLKSDKRPAIQLMDEDEAADRSAFDRGRKSTAPNVVLMTPGIYVFMQNKKPENVGIGTDLNTFCGKIIKGVLADEELKDLVASEDGLRYEGMNTDLAEDRTAEGKARIAISFLYYLSPDEL